MPQARRQRQRGGVHDLDHNQLRCRLLSHSWDEIPVTFAQHRRKHAGGIHLTFRCVRCHCLRHETWSRGGRLEVRTYTYPKEYLGRGRVERSAVRVEYLGRRRQAISAQRARPARKPVRRQRRAG